MIALCGMEILAAALGQSALTSHLSGYGHGQLREPCHGDVCEV